MKAQLPYGTALRLATQLVERFAPDCQRIEIAGSLRRQKPTVGDIELVIIPKPELYKRLDALLGDGKISHTQPKRWGDKLRAFRMNVAGNNIQCDLFIQPDPSTWGVNLMIRTGSSDFSRKMVTSQAQKGWMPDCFRVHEARVWWRGKALDTPEETDVFDLWGMAVVSPELRTDAYLPTIQPTASAKHTLGNRLAFVNEPGIKILEGDVGLTDEDVTRILSTDYSEYFRHGQEIARRMRIPARVGQ